MNLWRRRYTESGVKGLQNEAAGSSASGRPVDDHDHDLDAAAEAARVTHWSSRLLADELEVAQNTVLRTWRHSRVRPWRSETFKFSTDPELVAKVTDVVGLYLAPRHLHLRDRPQNQDPGLHHRLVHARRPFV